MLRPPRPVTCAVDYKTPVHPVASPTRTARRLRPRTGKRTHQWYCCWKDRASRRRRIVVRVADSQVLSAAGISRDWLVRDAALLDLVGLGQLDEIC